MKFVKKMRECETVGIEKYDEARGKYDKLQTEIDMLMDYKEMLCPMLSVTIVGADYNMPFLRVAIEERIESIMKLQEDIEI